MEHQKLCWAYITAPSLKEAQLIATKCVDEALAACANIIPSIHSIYLWDGKICEDKETAILLKTSEANFTQLAAFVSEHHSYDVPCILKIDISDANPSYRNWLLEMLARKCAK